MSSFNSPHHLYLFAMQNGKKKLAYGPSPAEAYENLKLRLTPATLLVERGAFDRYNSLICALSLARDSEKVGGLPLRRSMMCLSTAGSYGTG